MSDLSIKAALAAIAACVATPAFAADYVQPPVVIEEPVVVEQPVGFGGWYIRGDVDYHKSDMRGADYITYGAAPCVSGCGGSGWQGVGGTKGFDTTELKSAFSIGGGVGYQITRHFRTDLTLDYWSKSKFRGSTSDNGNYGCGSTTIPCQSVDRAKMSALLLLANAYADLGTWNGLTPYVGAGIGSAHIRWGDLENDANVGYAVHKGSKNWRFAYALMAGASYCLTEKTMIDAGYRFSRIEGGRMFEYNGAGPGFDKGFNTHEVRAGLRYNFGGGATQCAQPETAVYVPEPIYTK